MVSGQCRQQCPPVLNNPLCLGSGQPLRAQVASLCCLLPGNAGCAAVSGPESAVSPVQLLLGCCCCCCVLLLLCAAAVRWCCCVLLTLHLALGVDNDTSIVLKVDVGALLPPPGLALAHDHSRGHCRGEGGGEREEGDPLPIMSSLQKACKDPIQVGCNSHEKTMRRSSKHAGWTIRPAAHNQHHTTPSSC